MKAGHGAEELDTGDPLDGRICIGKRIDQANYDVVTVDIVTLDRRLPAWPILRAEAAAAQAILDRFTSARALGGGHAA